MSSLECLYLSLRIVRNLKFQARFALSCSWQNSGRLKDIPIDASELALEGVQEEKSRTRIELIFIVDCNQYKINFLSLPPTNQAGPICI